MESAEYHADKVVTANTKRLLPVRVLSLLARASVMAGMVAFVPLWIKLRLTGLDHFAQYAVTVHLWFGTALSTNPWVGLEALVFFVIGLGVFKWGISKKGWLKFAKKPKSSGLHGTAGWATLEHMKDMAILPPSVVDPKDKTKHSGVFVGAYKHTPKWGRARTYYLRHDGPEHVLAFAPTRSGKGVGLVIPTLVTWEHSAIVHDPKGEAWACTSGFRHKHLKQNVFHFDPANPDTSCVAAFNPLAEIRLGTKYEVGDAQNIATILADPHGKGLEDHWAKTSHAILSGLVLHCGYYARNELGRHARFSDLAEFFSAPEEQPAGGQFGMPQQNAQQPSGLHKRLLFMRDYRHLGDKPHDMVAHEAQTMIDKEERERASVVSTAVSYLTLYRDPAIADNTSRSDWTIADIMDGDRPATAYLVVKPDSAERLRPLIRLIMTQIVRKLTGDMAFADGRSVASYKHRLLLLLDEFTALKKLTVVEEALAYMAGYGIKAYLIVQDIEQLQAVYGQQEMVVSNCHIKVAFAPNKSTTAKVISESIGKTTVVHKAAELGDKKGAGPGTWQETSRDLLTPEEAMRLKGPKKAKSGDILEPGAQLVMIAGQRPIYGTQVMYFMDPRLNARAKIPPPVLRYGEIGDTQGFVPAEPDPEQPEPIRGPEDTIADLMLSLSDAQTMPLWPTDACTGESETEESGDPEQHLSDAVSEIISMLEEGIEMRRAEAPKLGCRDYALAHTVYLPKTTMERVGSTVPLPKRYRERPEEAASL